MSLKAYTTLQQGKRRWAHSSGGCRGCRGSPGDTEQLLKLQPRQPQAVTALGGKTCPAPSPQCPGLRSPKKKETCFLLWRWLSQCHIQAVHLWACESKTTFPLCDLVSLLRCVFGAVFMVWVRCCGHPSICLSVHPSAHPCCPLSSGAAVPVGQWHERCLCKMNLLTRFLSPSLFISPWSLCQLFCFWDPSLPLVPPSPLISPNTPPSPPPPASFFLSFFSFLVFSLHLFFSLLSFLSSSAFFQSQQGSRIQIDPLPASNVIEALCGSYYLYGNYQGGLESGGRPNAPAHVLLFLPASHADHMGLTAHLRLLLILKKYWYLKVLKRGKQTTCLSTNSCWVLRVLENGFCVQSCFTWQVRCCFLTVVEWCVGCFVYFGHKVYAAKMSTHIARVASGGAGVVVATSSTDWESR